MNKYDEKYDIRLARLDEIDECMTFIDRCWRKGHILSIDRKLFEYEFVNNDKVNIIIAKERKTKEIEAFLGFIQCSDSDITKKDIWGSIWKVNSEHMNIPFLGVELAKRIYPITGCRMEIGSGVNIDTAAPLRKRFFKDKIARMKQFYLINDMKKDYKIAVINNKWRPNLNMASSQVNLKQYYSIDEIKKDFNIEDCDSIPYKDSWYIEKRYFKHPYYQYEIYGIENKSHVESIFVTRQLEHNGSKVLRIVDYLGNQEVFQYVGRLLYDIMIMNDYEYIDFYEFGFDDNIIEKAGFKIRDDNDIIPNYFEPFVQKNADIWVQYIDDRTLFFKADADQDRPNMIQTSINS